jgi:hypothetical protein
MKAARDGPPAMLEMPERWPAPSSARTKYKAGSVEASSSTKEVSAPVATSMKGLGTPTSLWNALSSPHASGTASQAPWTISSSGAASNWPPMMSNRGLTVDR